VSLLLRIKTIKKGFFPPILSSWSDLELSDDSSSGLLGPSSKVGAPVKGAFDPPPSTWRRRLPLEEPASSGDDGPPPSKVAKAVKASPSILELDTPFTPPNTPAKKAKKESKLR